MVNWLTLTIYCDSILVIQTVGETAKENKMPSYKVSYGDFQVKDFGQDKEEAKSFVKENGGVVFEITPERATGIADSQGDLEKTYTAQKQ